MPYTVFTVHPDADAHKNPNIPRGNWDSKFEAWREQNAPWVGASPDDMAELLKVSPTKEISDILDNGGTLGPLQVAQLAQNVTGLSRGAAGVVMFAATKGYPVRVEFEPGFANIKASSKL